MESVKRVTILSPAKAPKIFKGVRIRRFRFARLESLKLEVRRQGFDWANS